MGRLGSGEPLTTNAAPGAQTAARKPWHASLVTLHTVPFEHRVAERNSVVMVVEMVVVQFSGGCVVSEAGGHARGRRHVQSGAAVIERSAAVPR